MEWSDKRREMTFALLAEEIAFIVKATDECGLLKPFVTGCNRSCDLFSDFLIMPIICYKTNKVGNSGSKNCPNEFHPVIDLI